MALPLLLASIALAGLSTACTSIGFANVTCGGGGLVVLPTNVTLNPATVLYFDLSQNLIAILPGGAFSTFTSLQTLSVANNLLTFVNSSAFVGLGSLLFLDLSGNSVSSIAIGTFAPLRSVTTLLLSNNLLTLIPTNSFVALPSLRTLDLSNNSITVIAPLAFDGSSPFTSVNFNGNFFLTLEANLVSSLKSAVINCSASLCPSGCYSQCGINSTCSLDTLTSSIACSCSSSSLLYSSLFYHSSNTSKLGCFETTQCSATAEQTAAPTATSDRQCYDACSLYPCSYFTKSCITVSLQPVCDGCKNGYFGNGTVCVDLILASLDGSQCKCNSDSGWLETGCGRNDSQLCPGSVSGSVSRFCSNNGVWQSPISDCASSANSTGKEDYCIISPCDPNSISCSQFTRSNGVQYRLCGPCRYGFFAPYLDACENIRLQDQLLETLHGNDENLEDNMKYVIMLCSSYELGVADVANIADFLLALSQRPVTTLNPNFLNQIAEIVNILSSNVSLPLLKSGFGSLSLSGIISSLFLNQASISPLNTQLINSGANYNSTSLRTSQDTVFNVPKSQSVIVPVSHLAVPTPATIVITTYNDLTFFIQNTSTPSLIVSSVISIDVSGVVEDVTLPSNVTIIFNVSTVSNMVYTCVYWQESSLLWENQGCSQIQTNSTTQITCTCSHLTAFAVVASVPLTPIKIVGHYSIEIVVYIGCGISLLFLGLFMLLPLILTCTRFKSSFLLFPTCLMLIGAQITFFVGMNDTSPRVGCQVTAALIQFFLLSALSWLCVDVYRFSFPNISNKAIGFLGFVCFLFPAVTTAVSGYLRWNQYGDMNQCWLTYDNNLVWAFSGPALGYIAIFIVLYVTAVVVIIRAKRLVKRGQTSVSNSLHNENVRWLLFVLLFVCLVVVSWVLAAYHIKDRNLVYIYIFAIGNALQGIVLFVLQYMFNQNVSTAFKLWATKYCGCTFDEDRPRLQVPNKRKQSAEADDNPYKMHTQRRPDAQKIDSLETETNVDTLTTRAPRATVFTNPDLDHNNNTHKQIPLLTISHHGDEQPENASEPPAFDSPSYSAHERKASIESDV